MSGVGRLVAICVVSALTTAGCSGDDSPGPAVLASLSAEPSPSRLVSAVPSALTPQGAADFARYFFQVLDAAYNTGDTSTLEAISAPGCKVCDRYISSIKEIYGRGGRYKGEETSVVFAEAPAFEGDVASVEVIVTFPPQMELAPDGSVASTSPGRTRATGELSLRKSRTAWSVIDFTLSRP
ncbi:MAG TPA: DUF6318 family protein [Mycobacteriales bacterium]|nr:DUF6318 family protein [Mycobacteriales bacterium]